MDFLTVYYSDKKVIINLTNLVKNFYEYYEDTYYLDVHDIEEFLMDYLKNTSLLNTKDRYLLRMTIQDESKNIYYDTDNFNISWNYDLNAYDLLLAWLYFTYNENTSTIEENIKYFSVLQIEFACNVYDNLETVENEQLYCLSDETIINYAKDILSDKYADFDLLINKEHDYIEFDYISYFKNLVEYDTKYFESSILNCLVENLNY